MSYLSLGIQSFTKLRKNHCIYVDQTAYIWALVHQYNACVLNRPRRFGKSLLVSTLEAYFQGKKELFKGTAIAKLEKEWIAYPVIRFSFASGEFSEPDGLRNALNFVLDDIIYDYHLDLSMSLSLIEKFKAVLKELYRQTHQRIVILVDEYDTPIRAHEKNKVLYRQFFNVLKDEDNFVHFIFFTGVAPLYVLNMGEFISLKDISMMEKFNGICGFTKKQIHEYFPKEMTKLSLKLQMTNSEVEKRLANMYEGYHFSIAGESIYNPVSLLNAFSDCVIDPYWFYSGDPTCLLSQIQAYDYTIEDFIKGVPVYRNVFKKESHLLGKLYQSGYLTIKSYDAKEDHVYLAYPNREVREGMMRSTFKNGSKTLF